MEFCFVTMAPDLGGVVGDGLDRVGPCAYGVVVCWQLLLFRCEYPLFYPIRKIIESGYKGNYYHSLDDLASR